MSPFLSKCAIVGGQTNKKTYNSIATVRVHTYDSQHEDLNRCGPRVETDKRLGDTGARLRRAQTDKCHIRCVFWCRFSSPDTPKLLSTDSDNSSSDIRQRQQQAVTSDNNSSSAGPQYLKRHQIYIPRNTTNCPQPSRHCPSPSPEVGPRRKYVLTSRLMTVSLTV